MYSYATATVKDIIEEKIMLYDFEGEDELFKHVFQQIEEHYKKPLIRQDIPNMSMEITECWDMLAEKFTDYSLDWVIMFIDTTMLKWCANQIKELKKAKEKA